MGATVHPHSLAAHGSAAAARRACASSSSILINPACVAPASAVAVAKKPKRTGSCHEGDSPAKRARGACGEVQPDAATKIKARPRPGSDGDRCPAPAGSVLEALSVTKNQASASPVPLPEVAAPPKHPACSMSELLEKARLAKARSAAPAAAAADAEAVCRREIERRRAEARREIERVVRTVEFNDPFIDPRDVLK
jgi:hypothetical protein